MCAPHLFIYFLLISYILYNIKFNIAKFYDILIKEFFKKGVFVLKGIGQTHGKIILMGEHAVVYHQPCLALPFFKATVIATMTPSYQDQTIQCHFYSGKRQEAPDYMTGLNAVISHILTEFKQPNISFCLKIDSSIPIERGMGSSAAVSGAVVKALYDYFNCPLSQEKLLSLINIAETINHQHPSGIDALTTTSSQAVYFIKDVQPETIQLKMNATLIIADTGIMGQTKEAVSHIAHHINEENYQDAITTIGKLTNQARLAIENQDIVLLGHLMNQAHKQLQHLSVSSEELDSLVTLARQHGALGSKLTGGGRGGCIIALCENNKTEQLIQALTPYANKVWSMSLKGESL